MSNYNLIVHNPFGDYAKGALITDPAEVQRILQSDHHGHVLRIAPMAPVQPTAEAKPETQG
jgi:hypothetical protein